jgi:hypothetical protein
MKKFLFALPLVLLPGVAMADPGSGTDLYQVNRQVEAMQRDGRWDRLIAEGQANKQAFEAMRQQPSARFTASSPPVVDRRRRR